MTLATQIQDLATRVATECKALRTLINGNTADLSSLTTDAKSSLVAAINELQAEITAIATQPGGATIDDNLTSASTVWSSQKTQQEITAGLDALVAGAPDALDTLQELADALGDDPNFAGTVTTALNNRVRTDTAAQGLSTTEQANARTNIAAAAANHTHDLASASITGVLPVAKGGTGATTGAQALTNLGAAPVNHTHDAADITSGVFAAARLPAGTAGTAGIVQLATTVEMQTGTDTTKAATPDGVRAVTGDPETDFVATFEAGLV